LLRVAGSLVWGGFRRRDLVSDSWLRGESPQKTVEKNRGIKEGEATASSQIGTFRISTKVRGEEYYSEGGRKRLLAQTLSLRLTITKERFTAGGSVTCK